MDDIDDLMTVAEVADLRSSAATSLFCAAAEVMAWLRPDGEPTVRRPR